ncbi:MAG: VWA domain-containing protein [Treponema sp.]|nr:VWA domain-containing protein [Treponema sp.]
MISFENPAAFFALLLIPALFFLRALKIFTPITIPLTISDWNGPKFRWEDPVRKTFSRIYHAMTLLGFICAVTAWASPIIHKQTKVYSSRGTDILFVLDTSPSMAAQDTPGVTRLEIAKSAMENILNSNSGECVGIVEMAKEAALVVPPTMKKEAFFEKLKTIVPGELGDGTAIGTGISCAVFHLESSAAPKKCIVLLTDGENNSGAIHPYTAARLAKEKNITLYVLGLGTKGSVPLEYVDPKTGRVYSGFLDSNYNSQTLAKIASEAGGKFFEATNLSSLSQTIDVIIKNESVVQSYQIHNTDKKYYTQFLIATAVLLILSIFIRTAILREVL